MIVATWNVNSIKIRVENTLAWLKVKEPSCCGATRATNA